MNAFMSQLLPLVAQALSGGQDVFTQSGWTLNRVYGGMNGIIYRAESAFHGQSLAVKIRKRDSRNRAEREFAALQALAVLSEPVAPAPVGIYNDLPEFPGDIVIASWVDGVVLNQLAGSDCSLWERILTTCARIHAVKPGDTSVIRDAVVPVRSAQGVIDEIERRYARLPDGQLGEVTKADMGVLLDEFKQHASQKVCVADRLGLIVCDTNPSNMIECDGRIVIVDWESSGWGDPAFDIADLLVRPNCAGLSGEDRMWVMKRYAEIAGGDSYLIERIATYERLMLVFWLILTSGGFAATDVERFPGTRQFSLEETTRQQSDYLHRLDAVRHMAE